jgi:hypothetical protein
MEKNRIAALNKINMIPNMTGKNPGPISLKLPKSYFLATTTKKTPSAKNNIPDTKFFLLQIFIIHLSLKPKSPSSQKGI